MSDAITETGRAQPLPPTAVVAPTGARAAYERGARSELTQEIVRELLDYDPETGVLTWRWRDHNRSNNRWANLSEVRVGNIRVDKRQLHLGNFKTIDAAIAARKAGERKHGFSSEHGMPRGPRGENAMKRLGYSKGPQPRRPRLGMLPRRRIGRAKRFDIWDNVTGDLIIRNVDAATVVATYCPSLTAEGVISGVAEWHHIDADGYRVVAHFSIAGTT